MTEQSHERTILSSEHSEGVDMVIRDIYLAAFLHAMDYTIVEVETDGYYASFSFQSVPSSLVLNYYDGVPVLLAARKYYDSFQNLRRMSRQIQSRQRSGSEPSEGG